MPRTSGAKNNPKDLANEFQKLLQLYKDRGVEFPVSGAKPVASAPVVTPDPQNRSKRQPNPDPITFGTGDQSEHSKVATLECGNCHAILDQEYPQCPVCGCGLTW